MAAAPDPFNTPSPKLGSSPWLYADREELRAVSAPLLARTLHDMAVTVAPTRHSLWIIVRWPSGGGVLLRTAFSPDGRFAVDTVAGDADTLEVELSAAIGRFRVRIAFVPGEAPLVHWTVWLTPADNLMMAYWPVDVIPIDADGDPLATEGVVHAGQRGPATGLVYLSLTRPRSGSLLYVQNLTALNAYCAQTGTSPETRVGGSWPELGYTPPLNERQPLRGGETVIISDAFARFSPMVPACSHGSARLFLEMLADIYPHLPRPVVAYRHWPDRAAATLAALEDSPACSRVWQGRRFLNAYVGTGDRRPESLVQLGVLLAMLEYAEWRGAPIPLIDELLAGLPVFYNPAIGCLLRYPYGSEGEQILDMDEREWWELDSWYLYHPLVNLARLASRGHATARELLMASLPYAIRVARTLDYAWPVFFDARTLEPLHTDQELFAGGERDVPGLYAYLMLRVWEITGEQQYLDEARAAAERLGNFHFDLGYQFNNTAWAAIALLRLWTLTGEDRFRDYSYICLAGIFHNSFLWECDYGVARHYHTFMGVDPLHYLAYLATFEEYEVFAAYHEYLGHAGDRVPAAVRLLLSEYCKHTLSRDWLYYPSELPPEALATTVQNGYIDRALAIPLEDLHHGWVPAGRTGQEVYGAGAAFTFVTRAYHRLPDLPFTLFCEYPLLGLSADAASRQVRCRVIGDARYPCRVRVIPPDGQALPATTLTADGAPLDGVVTEEGHCEYCVRGGSDVVVGW